VIEIMDRPRREHIALYVAFVVITLGNGLAVLVLRRDPSSALAAGSPPGLALFFAAAGALLIAGLVSTLAGQHRLAWCAFAACLCWLAPIWIGWVHGPAIVRSIASMVAPVLLAFVAAMAVRGWLVIAGFLGTGLITALLILVRNPFFDPGCWDDCGSTNVFLASSVPELARGLELGWAVFTGVFGLVVVAVSWMQWAVLTRVGRRAQLWLVVPVTASALVWIVEGVLEWRRRATGGFSPPSMATFVAQACALLALAVGLLCRVGLTVRRRKAVERLIDQLGAAPAPGKLEEALRQATGDPRLRVSFWLPERQRQVDASGLPVSGNPGPGRVATTVVRGMDQVAVIEHDPSLSDLATRIGPATRLALDNERLRASLLSHVAELRESRARIVAAADLAGQRVERDLHDGAQQRLLAAIFELRLADYEVPVADRPALEAMLTESELVITEVRDIAHGLYPAILVDGGLESALQSIADRSGVPVAFEQLPSRRLPPKIERAIYLVVITACARACRPLRVLVDDQDDRVDVLIEGITTDRYTLLGDRVAALDGELHLDADRLLVTLPDQSTRVSGSVVHTN
jgi:signal transduction histidine kinase